MPRLDSYPAASSMTGAESVAVFQSGHVRTATTQQLKDFGGGGGGGGGGSGTVNSGTAGTLTYYAGTGTTVSPLTLGTNLSISGGVLNSASSLGTPAGTPGQLQYNNSGVLAGAIIGSGLSLSSGTLTATYSYSLPTASASVLGGVKVGTGLFIDGAGALSATGTSGVGTFNTRTGTVTLTTADVTGVLGSGLPVANGGTGATSAAAARTAIGVATTAFSVSFDQAAVVANGTITVVRKAPFAITINSLDYEVGSAGGSFTVAVQIAGTNVTGLSAVAVSSATSANATATAANTVSAGQAVTIVISSTTGSPTGANLQINATR